MSDEPNKGDKPGKPGKGGKKKREPMNDDFKLVMAMFYAMEKKDKDSWAANDWAKVAARRGLSEAAAKIRWHEIWKQFEAETKDEIITPPVILKRIRRSKPTASKDPEIDDNDDDARPSPATAPKGEKTTQERAAPHDDEDGQDDGKDVSPVSPPKKKRARRGTRGITTRRAIDNLDDIEDDGENVPSVRERLTFPNLTNPNPDSYASQVRRQEEEMANRREQQRRQDDSTRSTWGLPPAEGPSTNKDDPKKDHKNKDEGEGPAKPKKRTPVPTLADKQRKVEERERLARKREEDEEDEDKK
ncbi:uncharacterized protein PG986_003611 [Apiospora aurea]|uniref:Myb-like domain-containing protein n=1 Tax=Apiospora aurea TaxID=335848 RepID=A0ABR1QTR1_9PEZI